MASTLVRYLSPLVHFQNLLNLTQVLSVLLYRLRALVCNQLALEQQLAEGGLRRHRFVLDVVPELALTLLTAVILQVPRVVADVPLHVAERRAEADALRLLQLLQHLAELVALLASQLIDVIVEDALAVIALQLLDQLPSVVLTQLFLYLFPCQVRVAHQIGQQGAKVTHRLVALVVLALLVAVAQVSGQLQLDGALALLDAVLGALLALAIAPLTSLRLGALVAFSARRRVQVFVVVGRDGDGGTAVAMIAVAVAVSFAATVGGRGVVVT